MMAGCFTGKFVLGFAHGYRGKTSMGYNAFRHFGSDIFLFLLAFHSSLSPNIELGCSWPPIGVGAFNS